MMHFGSRASLPSLFDLSADLGLDAPGSWSQLEPPSAPASAPDARGADARAALYDGLYDDDGVGSLGLSLEGSAPHGVGSLGLELEGSPVGSLGLDLE